MRRGGSWFVAAAVVVTSLVGASPSSAALVPTPTVAAPMDATLTAALTGTGLVRAAVVLGSTATPAQLAALRTVGLDVVPYRVLPMVAVQGPAAAIRAAAALPFLRSLWGDHPLEATLEQSTEMIQADEAYVGLRPGCGCPAEHGVTGAGVRIAILDSG